MLTTRPELQGTLGMVASTHWLASAAGMSVLERGGNAVDAAVAAGFVLQVVEPHLNGPGGDVPVLVAAPGGLVQVFCGQGPTPGTASIERYRDLGLDLVPGTGLLAAVVPGAFGAWTLLLEQRGTWRLRDVLEPAIGYAAGGFPLLADTAATIARVQELFGDEWGTSAQTWLERDGAPAAGARFRNPVLADTYTRVVEEAEAASSGREEQLAAAREVFYRGFVAEALDSWYRTQELMDTSGRRHGGLLTCDDLAAWQPTVEQPVSLDYGGLTIHQTGPWGQGPVLLQWLQLLSGYDLAAMGHLSAEWVHAVVGTGKLAFADREAWYGSRAQMLWLEPGLPSSMAGGKRPRTTLTPSLATRDGMPHLAFGTPGGDQQDQWQVGFLLAHLHAGLDLQAAIDAPAFHSDHTPSSFYPRQAVPGRLVAQTRLAPDVLAALRDRGHDVQLAGDWSLGRLSAVGRDPEGR